MNEYRCTRNALYSHNCLGRDNLSARQGHYVEAESEEAALKEMRESFPNDWPCVPNHVAFTAEFKRKVAVYDPEDDQDPQPSAEPDVGHDMHTAIKDAGEDYLADEEEGGPNDNDDEGHGEYVDDGYGRRLSQEDYAYLRAERGHGE